jgi:hypothetical protein
VFGTIPWAKQGDLGSHVLKKADSNVTWVAGQPYEVSWGIRYNHGGGYSYRLCAAGTELTEACFQQTPLDFVMDKQKLRWNDGKEMPIKGTFVSEGTTPPNSMWAMNPIPRIDFNSGGSGQPAGWNGCRLNATTGGPLSLDSLGCRQFDPPCEEFGPAPWATVNGSGFWGDVEGACVHPGPTATGTHTRTHARTRTDKRARTQAYKHIHTHRRAYCVSFISPFREIYSVRSFAVAVSIVHPL